MSSTLIKTIAIAIISIFVYHNFLLGVLHNDDLASFINHYFEYNNYHYSSSLSSLSPSTTKTSVNNKNNRFNLDNNELFIIHPQVKQALLRNEAVVSLESTIITHGMPYPQNYETAKQVESIVRDNGAVPATIAIINGKIHVGLDDSQLLLVAKAGKNAVKTSRRDIAILLSSSSTNNIDQVGATTVSSTILVSSLVGIKVFVTGGIGGVHRKVEDTMDISADLTELARNDVTVICAGVKSILDIGKTLEYLETEGVTVLTYQSDMFPSFFTPTSAFKSPNRVDSVDNAAKIINANHQLQLNSGIVIAVPNTYQLPKHINIDEAINNALKEADKLGVKGKDITPFLLKRINEITDGESLQANIHLIKYNAKIGSQISTSLQRLQRQQPSKYNAEIGSQILTSLKSVLRQQPSIGIHQQQHAGNHASNDKYKVVVVGGAVVDMISHAFTDVSGFQLGTSNPGTISYRMGGVGRNIAETLIRLDTSTLFISMVGDDATSSMLTSHLQSLNASTKAIAQQSNIPTATYNAIMNKGDLVVAIAVMSIFDRITPSYIDTFKRDIIGSELIVFDGNIPIDTMISLVDIANQHSMATLFEPTSVYKSSKIINTPIDIDLLPSITFTSPNLDELERMSNDICERWQLKWKGQEKDVDEDTTYKQSKLSLCNSIKEKRTENNGAGNAVGGGDHLHSIEMIRRQSNILILAGMKVIIVKAGSSGVYIVRISKDNHDKIIFKHYDAPKLQDSMIIDATGAGDSFVGCFIWSIINQQHISTSSSSSSSSTTRITNHIDQLLSESMIDKAVHHATLCSKSTLQSSHPVSPLIQPSLFNTL